MMLSGHFLTHESRYGIWPLRFGLALAAAMLGTALFFELYGHWERGLRPVDDSYSALVYTFIAIEGQLVAAAIVMALYSIARDIFGKLSPVRRATLDNTALFWHYTVGQGLLGLVIVHGFPRVAT